MREVQYIRMNNKELLERLDILHKFLIDLEEELILLIQEVETQIEIDKENGN